MKNSPLLTPHRVTPKEPLCILARIGEDGRRSTTPSAAPVGNLPINYFHTRHSAAAQRYTAILRSWEGVPPSSQGHGARSFYQTSALNTSPPPHGQPPSPHLEPRRVTSPEEEVQTRVGELRRSRAGKPHPIPAQRGHARGAALTAVLISRAPRSAPAGKRTRSRAGLPSGRTSRLSRRSFRVCMVRLSWSMTCAGSRGRSPIVSLPFSFFHGPLPSVTSQRLSLPVSSRMASRWLPMVSFCCRTVSRSCSTVAFSSSSGGGEPLCAGTGGSGQPAPTASNGSEVQTKRLPGGLSRSPAAPRPPAATASSSPATTGSIPAAARRDDAGTGTADDPAALPGAARPSPRAPRAALAPPPSRGSYRRGGRAGARAGWLRPLLTPRGPGAAAARGHRAPTARPEPSGTPGARRTPSSCRLALARSTGAVPIGAALRSHNEGGKGRGRFKKERRKFPWRTRSAPWVSLYHSWHHVVWSVIIYNFCPAKDAALPQEPRRAQPHSAPSLPAASGHFGSRHTHTGCAATPAAPGHNFPLGPSLQVDAEDISPRNK